MTPFDLLKGMNVMELNQTKSLNQYALKTYGWVLLGVVVTALVSLFLSSSDVMLMTLINFPLITIILLFSQILVAILFARNLSKMNSGVMVGCYFVYAVLIGITFSFILFLYDFGDVALSFGISAIYFALLVIFGRTTNLNLLKLQNVLGIGLICLIVVEIVMLFAGLSIDTQILTAIGLILFTAITAYDSQKMKALYEIYQYDEQALKGFALYSAFQLYLDFINIFLYIVRIVSKRQN